MNQEFALATHGLAALALPWERAKTPASGGCDGDLVFGKVSGFSRAKKALDAAAKLSTPGAFMITTSRGHH